MTAQSMDRQTTGQSFETSGIAFSAGLALGALVSLSAFLLARYGPTGDGWSFRGNGALAAYAFLPAILAGGWTAVVLHYRHRPWLGLGFVAAAVGIALALMDAALLPLFGSSGDQTVGPIVLILLIAWIFVAPALAMRFPRESQVTRWPIAPLIAAALLWVVGLACGLILLGLILPAGS